MVVRPYFLKNKDWYYFDAEKFRYMLTDKAPKKAVKSYNEWYRRDVDDDGWCTEELTMEYSLLKAKWIEWKQKKEQKRSKREQK